MSPEEFAAHILSVPGKLAGMSHKESLQAVVPVVHQSVVANFGRQVSSDGSVWPAHAPLTILLHGPHPLLILSGDMLSAAAGGSGALVEAGDRSLEMGIDSGTIPYAWKQQEGYRPGRIPQREFYYLHEDDMPEADQVFGDSAFERVSEVMGW
jgi:hypothetical protein